MCAHMRTIHPLAFELILLCLNRDGKKCNSDSIAGYDKRNLTAAGQ